MISKEVAEAVATILRDLDRQACSAGYAAADDKWRAIRSGELPDPGTEREDD